MKKKIFVVVLLCMVFSFFHPLVIADLTDFKEAVEAEEDKKEQEDSEEENKESTDTENSGSYYTDDEEEEEEESCMSGCFSILFKVAADILAAVWITHNTSVSYGKYPYCPEDENHFHYLQKWDDMKFDEEPEDWTNSGVYIDKTPTLTKPDKGRSFYFNATVGTAYILDDSMGSLIVLSGRFCKFIGPEIEYNFYANLKRKGVLAYGAAGINIPWVQTDPWKMDMYFQYAWLTDYNTGDFDKKGIAMGFLITSFPVKPISFHFRAGGRFMGKLKYSDIEARIGVHVGRLELFGGYRYSSATLRATLQGPEAGLRIWL